MRDFNFKRYIENLQNIFGFEQEINHAQNSPRDDELPIRRFSIGDTMERLMKNDLSLGKPKSKFISEIQWGDQPGAILVEWTPRLNVKIQKLHHDRQGNNVWILKRYFFVNDKDFAGQEDVVADEIYEQVRAISEEPLESVMESNEFKFENVVYSLIAKTKVQNYDGAIEYQRVVKLSENEYDLLYYVKGGGVGALYGPRGQRQVLSFVVKMKYDEATGLINAVAEMIESVDDTTNWTIQPAEFDELFLPTQSRDEISTTITTALKWF